MTALLSANDYLAHRLTLSLHFTEKFKAYFYLFCSTATQLYTKPLGKGSARQFKSCANGRPMPTSKTEVDLPHFTYAVKTATMKLAGFSSWQDASQTSKTMYVIIKLDK